MLRSRRRHKNAYTRSCYYHITQDPRYACVCVCVCVCVGLRENIAGSHFNDARVSNNSEQNAKAAGQASWAEKIEARRTQGKRTQRKPRQEESDGMAWRWRTWSTANKMVHICPACVSEITLDKHSWRRATGCPAHPTSKNLQVTNSCPITQPTFPFFLVLFSLAATEIAAKQPEATIQRDCSWPSSQQYPIVRD